MGHSLGRRGLILSSAMLILPILSQSVFAGGFALREQSSYYQGLSFAGNATTGPSISSVFWNPATITGARDGLTAEFHNTLIVPRSYVDVSPSSTLAAYGNSGDIGSDAWIGSNYVSYNVNDRLYLGLGINAPFGLSTKPNFTWAGQVYNRSSKVFSVNANPMIGYKINDRISVGFGAQIQYLSVRLKSASGVAVGAASTVLEGDDVGIGVTAGVTIRPMKGTEIGLGYRSGVSHGLSGTLFTPVAAGALPPGTYNITADLITTDTVTLSAKQSVNEKLRLLGSVEWANWSRLKQPAVKLASSGTQVTSLRFNYDDGYFVALGAEYDYNEQLTFRAGAAYEWSPIDTAIRSARLPDNDRIWVSGGATYNVNDRLSLDFGYSHIFGTDTKLRVGPGHQDFNGVSLIADVDSSVDILSASLRYTF